MHELALMESLVATVVAAVETEKVLCVRLEIGALAAVVPDSLRFCFDVCTHGTSLEGAVLEIIEIPARARCRTCGRESEFEITRAVCLCGGFDLQVLAGEELRIKDVEVT